MCNGYTYYCPWLCCTDSICSGFQFNCTPNNLWLLTCAIFSEFVAVCVVLGESVVIPVYVVLCDSLVVFAFVVLGMCVMIFLFVALGRFVLVSVFFVSGKFVVVSVVVVLGNYDDISVFVMIDPCDLSDFVAFNKPVVDCSFVLLLVAVSVFVVLGNSVVIVFVVLVNCRGFWNGCRFCFCICCCFIY